MNLLIQANSCRSNTIFATNSSYILININNEDAGKEMIIYGGDEIYINVTNSNGDFSSSTIETKQVSSSITLDCKYGNYCNNNYINGTFITQSVNISCHGLNTDCNNNTIYSSNSINIECSMCQSNNIYVINQTNLNLHCANDPNACTSSKIWFGANQIDFWIDIIWDIIDQNWIYR